MKAVVISGSRADYGSAKAVADALDAQIWDALNPGTPKADLFLVAGDRFEILRSTVELFIAGCTIGHISGGDVTEGSQDDSMRHAITKLSHLHFVTSDESARRVIQMGEEPWRVHNVGYPGADNIELIPLVAAKHLAGIPPDWNDFLLVVWHPDTLASEDKNVEQAVILTRALERANLRTLIVGPNHDTNWHVIAHHLRSWCQFTDNNKYVDNLPRRSYLTLLKHCQCLVGNSSSGFFEAPSFGTSVVNIGDRQKGRKNPPNMVSCGINVEDIVHSIYNAPTPLKIHNPYGDGLAAQRIAQIISDIKDPKQLLKKRFHDIQSSMGRDTLKKSMGTLA